jgi:hypothetical protein
LTRACRKLVAIGRGPRRDMTRLLMRSHLGLGNRGKFLCKSCIARKSDKEGYLWKLLPSIPCRFNIRPMARRSVPARRAASLTLPLVSAIRSRR